MIRPGGWGRAACVLLFLLAAQCDGQNPSGMGMGMGKMGKGGKAVKKVQCEVTVRGGGKEDRIVDDGHDTIELRGKRCRLVDGAPPSGALVCFLYSALVIMPVLYYLSVHENTSDYTWVFLDSFMGIFIAILWWSCFDESFNELDFPHRVGVFVIIRCFVVPGILYFLADHDHLFGIASILKHVVAFIAVSTGTEALKFGSGGGPPSIKLPVICLLVIVFNLAIWKLKNQFVEMFLKESTDPRHMDRWDEVATELGLDATALCLAAMAFLSANMLYFKKIELLQKDANLSMTNTSLFDQAQEGEFAALYSLLMFAITIVMEHIGGPHHGHPEGEQDEVPQMGEVAKCKRMGKVNGQEVQLWERVVVGEGRGDGKVSVQPVSSSVLDTDRVDRSTVRLSDLRPAEEEQWDDYFWHLMQLAMMASASWSGLLALCFLVRQHWFPALLDNHIEGSLFVSVILMFMSGLVIAALSAHAAGQNKFLSNKLMKYFRVYFLRAVSLMAALSWDMTFDAAVEELPIEAFVSEDHALAGKFLVASLVSFFIAPIYVLGMRPNIHAATALLEHKEKEEMHEKDD